MKEEKKTYYEKQLENLNKFERAEDKKKYYETIDFSIPIEKDSDAGIIRDLNIFYDLPFKSERTIQNERIRELLENGRLWDVIVDEIGKKHVGDISAKEIILVSAIGRLVKNKKPFSFNLIIHSSSSAGKDHLVESALKLFPERDIEAFGRISKTALTYLHDSKKEPFFTYDGKILYLEEITESILNNEIMKVFTAGLTKSAITKDQKAEVIEVRGKPVVICTTATTTPNPEILNRFSIVRLDESEEQTRRTYRHEEGEYDQAILNFLAELKPQKVIIPLEMRNKLAEIFPAKRTQMRRAFPRFLDIIKAITLFNNGLRASGELISTWEDYDLAVRIYSNYGSGVISIPLRDEDKKIIEFLEGFDQPMSVKEILSGTKGILSQSNIYRHLENLKENGILECFDLRTQPFNQPVKKYLLSDEMRDKNPINLPLSHELDIKEVPDIPDYSSKNQENKNMNKVKNDNKDKKVKRVLSCDDS